MLSNNGLCLLTAVQYVLLFLVWFNNSTGFKFTRSYSSRPFLCTLVEVHVAMHTVGRVSVGRSYQLSSWLGTYKCFE